MLETALSTSLTGKAAITTQLGPWNDHQEGADPTLSKSGHECLLTTTLCAGQDF